MTKIVIKWVIIVKFVIDISNTHKEFDKCKHMKLTIDNPDINNVDEVFYAYIIQHKKEYDYYRIKCHFKSVLKGNQYSTYVKSNLFDNKTMINKNKKN